MLRRPVSSVVLLLVTALPAWADGPGKAPKADNAWAGIVIAIVLAVGVIIASMTGSKRGHQD